MIGRIIFSILLVLSIFIEAIFLPFPFFVLTSILFFLFFEEPFSFLIIFLSALFLDRLLLHALASTDVFLFLFFVLIVVFEIIFTLKINTWIGIVIAFLGVEAYRQYMGYPLLWGIEVLIMLILISFAYVEGKFNKKEGKSYAS